MGTAEQPNNIEKMKKSNYFSHLPLFFFFFLIGVFSCAKESNNTNYSNEIVGSSSCNNSIVDSYSSGINDSLINVFLDDIILFKANVIANKIPLKSNANTMINTNTFTMSLLTLNTTLNYDFVKKPQYKILFEKMKNDVNFMTYLALKADCKQVSLNFEDKILENRAWNCHDAKWGGAWVFTKILTIAGGIAACETGIGCVGGLAAAADAIGDLSDCGWW